MICAGCELTAEGAGPGSFRKLTWYGDRTGGNRLRNPAAEWIELRYARGEAQPF